MAYVRPDIASRVAHLPGVKGYVHAEGRRRQALSEGRLAAHRDTGTARIEGHAEDTDYVVELVDPAALSIEFGRGAYTTKDGRHVGAAKGLYILTGD